MLKTTNVEFQSIEMWFTDQNNRLLEKEDNTTNYRWLKIVLTTYKNGILKDYKRTRYSIW